jgi:hypothetical protein
MRKVTAQLHNPLLTPLLYSIIILFDSCWLRLPVDLCIILMWQTQPTAHTCCEEVAGSDKQWLSHEIMTLC